MRKLLTDSVKISQTDEWIKNLNWLQKDMTVKWKCVFEAQTMMYNHKYQLMIYKVANCVWLSIRNFNQQRLSKKLSDKYIDLYTVLNLIGKQIYWLNLRNNTKHDTFHVSLLKPVKRHPQKPPKPILMKNEKKWLINFIVNKHVYERKHITQY